jgi:hypothetical protein
MLRPYTDSPENLSPAISSPIPCLKHKMLMYSNNIKPFCLILINPLRGSPCQNHNQFRELFAHPEAQT